jgi:YHS domain-containing protein
MRSLQFGLIATIYSIAAAASHAGPPRDQGIWKAVVPPKPMQGEFAGFDPIGVAVGVKIKADCSLNWISPDDGKRYCFASGTSLQYFLDRPKSNIERAQHAWQKLQSQPK